MGILFGLFSQIHLDLNFDSFKLWFMCNKLLHTQHVLKKNIIICLMSNHIQVFSLVGNPTKMFYSVQ